MEHRGKKLIVRYCESPPSILEKDAWVPPSWNDAMAAIPQSKHAGIQAKFVALRNILADGGQLRSPDYMNTEGNLPNGKHFYAIKAGKLRAYGWFSRCHPGVFYISHFAAKESEKLAEQDTKRVITNWRRIEERKK